MPLDEFDDDAIDETEDGKEPSQQVGGGGADEPPTRNLEIAKFQLDALKAIRESAFQRYEKRRSYEWRFSISIWTALAAFSGLALNNDFSFHRSAWIAIGVIVVGGLISGIQFWHLSHMFKHTIGDASLQRFAEYRMYELAFDEPLPEKDPREDDPPVKHPNPFHPPLSWYGLLQVAITVLLVIGAAACVLAPRVPANNPEHHSHSLFRL